MIEIELAKNLLGNRICFKCLWVIRKYKSTNIDCIIYSNVPKELTCKDWESMNETIQNAKQSS